MSSTTTRRSMGLLVTIVIPAFNRANLLRRAVDSCLCQDSPLVEIVVVDDGSSDDTWAVLQEFEARGVRILRHKNNCGVCAARVTGVTAARGEWIVYLDSDDEMLPGGVETVVRTVTGIDASIARVAFMYDVDTGGNSPDPPLADELWNYEEYLHWHASRLHRGDFLNCIRKDCLLKVGYPNSRALEASFHLDFSHSYLTLASSKIVARIHTDAPNRSNALSSERRIRDAADMAAAIEGVLERHGQALMKHCPQIFESHLRSLAVQRFFTGEKVAALRVLARAIQRRPADPKLWIVGTLGTVNPRLLAWLKQHVS